MCDHNEALDEREPERASDGRIYRWHAYGKGKIDMNDHVIESIHARCPDFVIYFCKADGPQGLSDLYYECTDTLLETTAVANVYLAQINRLVTRQEIRRRETLEFAADAYEMLLCGQKVQSEAILKDLADQLVFWRETYGRTCYQAAALFVAALIWCLYLSNDRFEFIPSLNPWLQAAALGATGGFFSVCLNLASIQVNVNQSPKNLSFAGGTRAAIALIAAIACLLAVQGKIVLGLAVAEKLGQDPSTSPSVLFFLFLAGFSETLIPNVLKNSEKGPA